MVKKITFSSLFFRGRDPILPTRSSSLPSSSCLSPPSTPSWAWPSCKHPRTDSFRDTTTTTTTTTPSNDIYKTTNSVYFDSAESWFTNSSEEHSEISLSTASEEDVTAVNGGDAVEAVIRGLRSERLVYEPAKSSGLTSSSIVEEAAPEAPFGESVAVAVESEDPYRDFRSSMEEMVAAQGLRDQWERLEELLVWYLRVNGEKTHGYIVGAFVDLVVGIALADHTSSTTHHDHPLASSSSSCSPSVSFEIEELKDDDDDRVATLDHHDS